MRLFVIHAIKPYTRALNGNNTPAMVSQYTTMIKLFLHRHRIGHCLGIGSRHVAYFFGFVALLAGCAMAPQHQDGPPGHHVDVSNIPNAIPRHEPLSRYGNNASYVVNGKRYYVLKSSRNYDRVGYASWYGTKFQNRLTSTREPYNLFAMTAASPNLPLPTYVRVTNLANGRSVIVRVNDRGPFIGNRIIDLSYVAAKKLGYANKGTARVRVQAINVNQPQLAHRQRQTTHQPARQRRHYAQVGAYRSLINAKKTGQQVAQITQNRVEIRKIKNAQVDLYRVQIGPLTQLSYQQLAAKLAQHGYRHVISVVE